MRASIKLIDESQLDFSEYFEPSPEATIQVVAYSYNWTDSRGKLILRWDNTPQYPDLPGSPITSMMERRALLGQGDRQVYSRCWMRLLIS